MHVVSGETDSFGTFEFHGLADLKAAVTLSFELHDEMSAMLLMSSPAFKIEADMASKPTVDAGTANKTTMPFLHGRSCWYFLVKSKAVSHGQYAILAQSQIAYSAIILPSRSLHGTCAGQE